MEPPRHLCSQLVNLSWSRVSATGKRVANSLVANMEEICRMNAVLECEEPVPVGSAVEIRWDGIWLAGRVSSVAGHEFGWRVEVEFSPLTPWLPETGKPAHFLDIAEL